MDINYDINKPYSGYMPYGTSQSQTAPNSAFGVLNPPPRQQKRIGVIPPIVQQTSPMAQLPENYIRNERTGVVTEIPRRQDTGGTSEIRYVQEKSRSPATQPIKMPRLGTSGGLFQNLFQYANDMAGAAEQKMANNDARRNEQNAEEGMRKNLLNDQLVSQARANTMSTLQKMQIEQKAAEDAQKPKQYQTPTNLIGDIVKEKMKSGIEGYDPAADFSNIDNQFRQQFANGQYRQRLAADISSAQGDAQKINQAIMNAKSRGVPQSVIDELMNQ